MTTFNLHHSLKSEELCVISLSILSSPAFVEDVQSSLDVSASCSVLCQDDLTLLQ